MKNLFLLLSFAFTAHVSGAQDVYLTQSAKIAFFSSTPIEDIDAKSDTAVAAVNPSTKDVYFKVKMKSFKFKKALMEEHFNENYVESDKFPFAQFKGKINESVDLTKDGTYPVTVTGDLTIHGITQNRTIPGTVTVKGQTMEVTTEFQVKLVDHKIEVPTVVVKNIAEIIDVKVAAKLTPAPKKS